MFGYIVPQKSKLSETDFSIYRSFYCGICKVTGQMHGQLPRFTTNFDMVFLSVLLHEYNSQKYDLEHKGCVLNPRKRYTVMKNELFEKIIDTNIILSYHKALDGVSDKEGIKYRMVRNMLKKPYSRAKEKLQSVDIACKEWYTRLGELEKDRCESVDRVADCFANLLKSVVDNLVEGINADGRLVPAPTISASLVGAGIDRPQTTDPRHNDLLGLSYHIGKFVYLVDALDDICDDYKKGRYNPFLVSHKLCKKTDKKAKRQKFSRKEFIAVNHGDLQFMLAACVNSAIAHYNNLKPSFSCGGSVLQNIMYYGMRQKCEELLNSTKKLPSPKL
ncbi:MAG: DUF5685 family protein [Firmicutes bacterium]|nr:DUF5685 family protein [Bacillota bacterium]